MRSSVSGQESVKVGVARVVLFLRQGGRVFGGFGETFGEGEKLVKSGSARENERGGVKDDVVRHTNVVCIRD